MHKNTCLQSLRSLALRICIANANNISSLGDLPFSLVGPILQACSTTQLAFLEDQSPRLREDTQEIWNRHVLERFKREFDRTEDEDWRDVYMRLKEEENERLENATARLRAKNGKIKEEKLAKQIVVIDPRKVRVLGEQKRSNLFGPRRGVQGYSFGNSTPQRKKNSIMEKARRDTSITVSNYACAQKPLSARSNRVLGTRGSTAFKPNSHTRFNDTRPSVTMRKVSASQNMADPPLQKRSTIIKGETETQQVQHSSNTFNPQ